MNIKFHENLRCDELIENRIIWLDATINDSDDSIKTKNMLLELNSTAQFYIDSIQCINDIKSIINEQILFIISGSLAQIVLSEIHSHKSIIAIFIFCANQQHYESLKYDYDKIVEIFIDQDNLIKSIRQILNLLEKQAMSFSLFDQDQKSSRDLSKESAIFLWHQLLLHILEQMPRNEQSKEELLVKCEEYYRFDNEEMKKIDKFRKFYSHENAIEWYTKECFLYKLLNKALRSENIELIYSFRFFIIDLSSQIKQEQFKQIKTNEIFTSYRGQRISAEEFERWKNNLGTIISINSFFSTSRDINVSLRFVRRNISSDDFRCVLFEIEIDPSIKSIIYADISHINHHFDEQEILFNLNSLFKIISIEFNSTKNIWIIKLKTIDEGTRDIEEYLKYIQQEIDECSPIIYFGWLLLNELDQIDQAEKYFQMLLQTLPSDHQDFASVYNGIGRVYSKRNQLQLALENYEIALRIRQEKLPSNHLRIAASFHNIANILKERGDLDQALVYYKQALEIEECHHPDDRLQKTIIIQNIGNTFTEKNDLETALKHLSRADDIFQRILPEKHPIISTCLGDIGFIYEKKGDITTALDYYHKALEIDEYCLPSDHSHLTKDLQNIVFTYKKNGEMEKAYKFCSNKLVELRNTSGNNHTRIAQILMTMANLIEEEKYFKQALQFYEEALINLEKSRSINQRIIARCLEYIGRLYAMYGKFDQALPKLLEALEFYRQIWLSGHIDIANVCRTIGLCYQKTNKPLEALEYFKESLSIYQVNYRSDHEKVKIIEDDIAKLNDEQQQITTNNTESIEEIVNNEQFITVIIDSDAPSTIVEPLSLPAIDSESTPHFDQSEIKNEPKITVKKRKLCQNCQIL